MGEKCPKTVNIWVWFPVSPVTEAQTTNNYNNWEKRVDPDGSLYRGQQQPSLDCTLEACQKGKKKNFFYLRFDGSQILPRRAHHPQVDYYSKEFPGECLRKGKCLSFFFPVVYCLFSWYVQSPTSYLIRKFETRYNNFIISWTHKKFELKASPKLRRNSQKW